MNKSKNKYFDTLENDLSSYELIIKLTQDALDACTDKDEQLKLRSELLTALGAKRAYIKDLVSLQIKDKVVPARFKEAEDKKAETKKRKAEKLFTSEIHEDISADELLDKLLGE